MIKNPLIEEHDQNSEQQNANTQRSKKLYSSFDLKNSHTGKHRAVRIETAWNFQFIFKINEPVV